MLLEGESPFPTYLVMLRQRLKLTVRAKEESMNIFSNIFWLVLMLVISLSYIDICCGNDSYNIEEQKKMLIEFKQFQNSETFKLSLTCINSYNGKDIIVGGSYSSPAMSYRSALLISRDGGKTWEDIILNTENDGSYDWIVAGDVSVNCLLKVEPVTTTSKGTTQGLFTIGEGRFVEIQSIPTNGAHDWESFEISGETYIAVANSSNGSSPNIDTRIYKWNDNAFLEIQAIPTNYAHYFESFFIDVLVFWWDIG